MCSKCVVRIYILKSGVNKNKIFACGNHDFLQSTATFVKKLCYEYLVSINAFFKYNI